MKKDLIIAILIVGVLFIVGASYFFGCARMQDFTLGSSGTTNLKSTSLSAASALRAKGITVSGTYDATENSWNITPINISGEVMSIVLPVAGEEDEGITPFGSGRPDIAPANSTLYPFNLGEITTLTQDSITTKPGYKGGTCNQIIVLFGYFDVNFEHNSATRTIRFYYGDTGSTADPATIKYRRGDKLLYNASAETTSKFYWYNTTDEVFAIETGSRPTYPAANDYVKGFSDPVRPTMHYYMLGATLEGNTDYDGTTRNYITLTPTVIEDKKLTFTVDFDVQNAVIFRGVTTEPQFNALSDADLIQKFDMKQNTKNGWSDTGLKCSIIFTSVAK